MLGWTFGRFARSSGRLRLTLREMQSIGIRFALVNDDPHHAQTLARAEEFDGSAIVATDALWSSTGNALSRMDRRVALQILAKLREPPGGRFVNLAPEVFAPAFDLYRHHTDKQWGPVDCVPVVVTRRLGLTMALAFNRHFVQAGLAKQRVDWSGWRACQSDRLEAAAEDFRGVSQPSGRK